MSAPELELAEQHDAAGRHDDAINALARATQRGDIEAMTRLAKRLVIGDRAPLLPRDGSRFLVEAAQKGGAEAAARLAVLAAVGAQVAQSWDDALNMLVVAAERGWEPAQRQLVVLASDPASNEARDGGGGLAGSWRSLRTSVDIRDWIAAPDGDTLHADPLIRTFPALLSDPVCAWLIEQARGRLARARVYNPVRGEDVTSETRTNTAANFNLVETDLVCVLAQTRMAAACGMPLHNMEAMAVLHYDIGEQITEHFDFVDPTSTNYAAEVERLGQRVITFLVYLNDSYEGGETDFPKLGVTHRGRRGEGLFFVNALASGEPDPRTVHAGRPPINGEKWVLSQFIRNRRTLSEAVPGS